MTYDFKTNMGWGKMRFQHRYIFCAIIPILLFSAILTGNLQAQYKTEFADTVILTSDMLPYSASRSDLLILTDGNLFADGSAIDIGDRNDVMVDGGGDTIFFGISEADNSYGIKLSYSPERIQIKNLTIIHDMPDISSARGCDPIHIMGDDSVWVENVNMVARGVEGNCLDATTLGGNGISNLWIRDCACENLSHSFENRSGDPAAAIRVCADGSTLSGDEFTGKLENVTVTTTPHSAVYATGSNDHRPVMIIHDCSLTVDAHNDMYDTTNATSFHSSGDPYAISVYRLGAGSQIYNNIIRSGESHEGGQGMIIQGARGTSMNPIEIYNNDIRIHCGPNQYNLRYGSDGKTVGFYLRWPEGNSNMSNCFVQFHDNIVMTYADALNDLDGSGTLHTGSSAQGIRIHVDSGFHNCEIMNNRVFALRSDSLVDSGYVETVAAQIAAVDTMRTDTYALKNKLDVYENIFYGNYYYAPTAPLYLGSLAQHELGGGNLTLYGDTLHCPVPADGNSSVKFPQEGTFRYSSTGSRLIDCTFLGYSGDDQIVWGNINTDDNCLGKDLRYARTAVIHVQDSQGNPLPGVTVSITNNYGHAVSSGVTDPAGNFIDTVVYSARHYNSPLGSECYWEDSLNYNDFTISINNGADSTTSTLQINAGTVFPLSVTLADAIPPNTPPTIPTGYLPNCGDTLIGSIHVLYVLNSSDSEDDPLTYDFRISLDTAMTQIIESDSYVTQGTGGTTSFTTSALYNQGARVFWQARAFDGQDYSSWSQPSAFVHFDFFLGARDLPIPLSPLEGEVVRSIRPSFSIQNLQGDEGVKFYFEVADNADFNGAVLSGPIIGQNIQTSWAPEVDLKSDTRYFWRVRAEESAWTSAISFELQGNIHVSPNPYRPYRDGETMTFRNIPENADIVIATVAGDVVREINDAHGPDVPWDGRNSLSQPVASGVYLYFVSSQDRSETGKFAVIK